MNNEENFIQKFSEETRQLFLIILVGQDSIVQKRGDFFVTVMREIGSQTAFSYQVRCQGKFYNINISYLSKGQVKIETSLGSKENYQISELTRTKVENIVVNWLKKVEYEKR